MRMSESPSTSGRFVRRKTAWAFLATLLLCMASTNAPAQDAEVDHSCGDFLEPKDRAVVSSPVQMPSVYLARLIAGDAERVVALFAIDGVHRGPDGVIRKGRPAIQKFYESVLVDGPRKLAVGRSVADDRRVAFELINLMEPCVKDDPALAVDLMDINEDGQIQEFTMFSRPRPH